LDIRPLLNPAQCAGLGASTCDSSLMHTGVRDMATETETKPSQQDTDTGEGDGYAHYARKEEITRGAIEGGTITALCGFRFSPVRDPQRFPVCPKCKELAAMLWGSD
jgi:Protein of unknown function (DUF3039)